MEIMKLFDAKNKKLWDWKIPTIVFFGDSVTQGCFEFYMKSERELQTVFDKEHAFHNYIAKIFNLLYPEVPVNIINAGISGSNAVTSLKRIERDVLSYSPDLTVVSFGLNDSFGGEEGIKVYCDALRTMFEKISQSGSEIIFMTQNMMNTQVSCNIKEPYARELAEKTAKIQNEGMLGMYFDAAKKVAAEYGVKVCDLHAKWKKLYENGVNVTELLANNINHPKRELNWLSAYSLVETMMDMNI